MARILYASQGYCTHDRRFLEGLSAAGHEMWFLPCEGSSIRRNLIPTGSAVRWLPPLRDSDLSPGKPAWAEAATSFRSVVHNVCPDLIHAGPVPTAGFFAASAGFHPLLMMSWGSDVLSFPNEGPEARAVTEFALRRADMAIADCEAVRERIVAFSGLTPQRIVCLPWGVDLEMFRPTASTLGVRRQRGWTDCKVIISTRAFEPIHAPFVFLEAIEKVLSRRSDVRVMMLGNGSLRRAAERFIQERRLLTKVHLAGQVPEEILPEYFAEAALYVSATIRDGSSVSLLQAMACGLPVIVADAYGNRDWVTHCENGWLYPAGNAEALAQTILQALEDESARRAAAERNTRIARARADWKRNFLRVLAAVDQLLGGKHSGEAAHDAQLQNR
jgi:L-malate glycosyltransferase